MRHARLEIPAWQGFSERWRDSSWRERQLIAPMTTCIRSRSPFAQFGLAASYDRCENFAACVRACDSVRNRGSAIARGLCPGRGRPASRSREENGSLTSRGVAPASLACRARQVRYVRPGSCVRVIPGHADTRARCGAMRRVAARPLAARASLLYLFFAPAYAPGQEPSLT